MNKVLFGVLGGLLLVAAGLFWWQGRGYNSLGAAPPRLAAVSSGTPVDALPSGDPAGMRGAAPPEASEATREQKRFDRLDRDHDGRITRNEMLAPRAAAFRKLDTNHDNLLTFEEWSVRTIDKFAQADANHDGSLTRAEFATTKSAHKKPTCRCASTPRRRGGKNTVGAASGGDDGSGDGDADEPGP